MAWRVQPRAAAIWAAVKVTGAGLRNGGLTTFRTALNSRRTPLNANETALARAWTPLKSSWGILASFAGNRLDASLAGARNENPWRSSLRQGRPHPDGSLSQLSHLSQFGGGGWSASCRRKRAYPMTRQSHGGPLRRDVQPMPSSRRKWVWGDRRSWLNPFNFQFHLHRISASHDKLQRDRSAVAGRGGRGHARG
jgi:hypothetical protein